MAIGIDTALKFGCAAATEESSLDAAARAADRCLGALGGVAPDLAFLFFSGHHASMSGAVAELVQKRLGPRVMVGTSAEGVLGGRAELEGVPGISILAGVLPGVELKAFSADDFEVPDGSDEGLSKLSGAMGISDELRSVVLFADPFSAPMSRVLPAMSRLAREAGVAAGAAGKQLREPVVMGGMASAGKAPGENRLVLNGRTMTGGLVGVTLSGAVRVDCVVSQGCRAFGPAFVITKARGNIIFELGGRPALRVLQEAVAELSEEQRAKLPGGPFIGRVINEYKERFGRSDYLIRTVMGFDPNTGAVAVGDLVRVGQTIRFHARDAQTASEDLALLMDAQKLYEKPAGALLVTCNGRGSRLFEHKGHDINAVAGAFERPRAGEDLAKGGAAVRVAELGPGSLPVAGFFAQGEIGPVGDESFLHGQTACVALFRRVEHARERRQESTASEPAPPVPRA